MKRTILGKYKLLNAMHAAGFNSFEELSHASGVSRQTFYNMMRGNFNTQKLDKIAAALNVSPISLLTESQSEFITDSIESTNQL